MALAVTPVDRTAPVAPFASGNANGVNPYATYVQALQLQDLNTFLSGNQSTASANDNNTVLLTSDLLDLSPAALNVLNGVSANAGFATTLPGLLAGTDVNNTTGASLTPTQQQQVAAIVTEFANQPATAQTFSQIETALTAAGIDPVQLSLQQLLEGYNYAYVPGYAFNQQLLTETVSPS